MSESNADPESAATVEPLLRRNDEIEYESVSAADGLQKGVLIDETDGAPHFAIRRFVLEPGAEVPAHTNAVEHEQYVLEGSYTVGISDTPESLNADGDAVAATEDVTEGTEYDVSAGDSLLIPAGTVHWYRNAGDEPGAFLCAVPNGDDEIELLD